MSTIQTLNNGESGLSHRNKLNTNFSNLNTDKVEKTTTVNGQVLSSNVTLTTDDVSEGSTNKYDKVVALTEGTNVTITGTYPNFTIAATGGAGDVTASGTLTDDAIILGGGTKTVKTSSKSIVSVLIGSNDAVPTDYAVTNAVNAKQDTLVSGSNIKTINGQSVLGSGDIEITSGGGGGFTPVYLTNLTSTTNPSYKQTSYSPDVSETIVSAVTNNNEVLAQSYIYDSDIGITTINAGSWVFNLYAYVSSAVGVTKFRIETFKRTSGGTETTLFSINSDEINNTTRALHQFTTTQGVFSCNATDRLGTKVYVNTTAVINITASFVVGDGNASFFTTPLQLRASQVRNAPSGNISATDVQGAINELDSEKVPTSRTLTINGTTYDLSADRSWTVSGGASIETSVAQIRSFI